MRINRELAEQIRAKAQSILIRDVIVTDASGQIMAGGETPSGFSVEAFRASQEGHSVTADDGLVRVHWSPFVYEDQTVGVFGITASASDQITPEAVSLLQGLAEVIVNQYLLIDRVHSSEVVKATFIRELLQAPTINPEEIYRQADIMQLTLRSAQAVMLFSLKGFEKRLMMDAGHLSQEEQRLQIVRATEMIDERIKASFQNYQDNIVAYADNDTFILLKGIGGENLNTLNTIRFLKEKADYLFNTLSEIHQKSLITVGVGQYYPDLGGLRKSYQDAQLALSVGLKVWGPGRIYHIKEVGMYVTLANVNAERKAELAHQILNPLVKNQQLFSTVQMFLNNNLNLTEAAAKLHVHRNTLIYRLDKTKKLINLDPRHFDDALQIKLGLMFYQGSPAEV
ncbi:MAG TPA: helix-turn-helix domain-containing protein [Candidatus Saccharimonadales bacterium]|nr:helix-turn-helix domain-containing protein [Candidatus Saccharimonadales bacterium]